MTDLLTRFSEDIELKGLSQRTIKMYTRAVKQLKNIITNRQKKFQTKSCVNTSSITRLKEDGPELLPRFLSAALNISILSP